MGSESLERESILAVQSAAIAKYSFSSLSSFLCSPRATTLVVSVSDVKATVRFPGLKDGMSR